MYFFQLPGYNPQHGISTVNHGKFPFLSSISGLFEPTLSPFEYNFGFPFQQIETDDNQIFYVSEPNLTKIFKNNVSGKNEILLENAIPITQEYTNELIELFYQGYSDGLNNFEKEIGLAFPSISFAKQKELLKQFMDYCQRDLYFEGFAIPELIQNLGYIQACLLRAFKEYRNLFKLATSEETGISSAKTDIDLADTSGAPENNSFQKLPLKYPVTDIITIWLVLLDLPKSRTLNLTQEFKQESDIIELLGSMFADVSGEEASLPGSIHRLYDLSLDYQPILYLLMHATYKLNYTYTRLPLEEYSKCLKATFSVFDSIELNHMPGNFTKKQTLAISVLKELTNSAHAKNALQILAKIPNYRIRL